MVWVLAAGELSAESIREQVEADWRRQDECRVAEIREPGLVRFVETELQWPGVKPEDRFVERRDDRAFGCGCVAGR